jgi:hypothetical protein
MVKVIAWNIGHKDEPWRELLESDADLALLSEAAVPPADVAAKIDVDPSPWLTAGAGTNRPWKAAIVKLSDRIGVEWISCRSIQDAIPGEVAITRPGTLAAAIVSSSTIAPFVAVAMYSVWERPFADLGSSWIYADASAHRLISDLSVFIGAQRGHRILAAGDLNILYGYGESGSEYWARRYDSVFSRFQALGLKFVGPQAPHGRMAEPWPHELPADSLNVPTYYSNRQSPETATRQLDFVFASEGFADGVRVQALNQPNNWGASDHCRIQIEVQG